MENVSDTFVHFILFCSFFQISVIFFDNMFPGSLVFLVTITVSVFTTITCVEPVVPLAQSQPIQQGTKLSIIIYYIGRTKNKGTLVFLFFLPKTHKNMKVRMEAKIRERYNQVPHLAQDTTLESNKNTINITNKSQEVSPSQQVATRH